MSLAEQQPGAPTVEAKRGGFVSCDACPWRQGDIFKPVSPADIAAITGFKKDHIRVPAGRTLVRRDAKQASFYTLFEGWAYRYATVNGGRQIFLASRQGPKELACQRRSQPLVASTEEVATDQDDLTIAHALILLLHCRDAAAMLRSGKSASSSATKRSGSTNSS